ncbi:hypothetical protein RIF29_26744 [Crotalaria pallida]|uniref:Uncharacterized protein n=1 Tax=Crotalaria pallida TaxID=3830 RepID=A0AAN9EN15_CROPI
MGFCEEKLHIIMFPWLAFGHMIPYLELAKLIAQKGHHISFVSTPRNIQRLPKLPPNIASLIKYVSLPLPKVPNLPENAEATIDIPYEVVQRLKEAYDALQEPFTHFLQSSNADCVFHDFVPFWASPIASKLGIRSVFFSIFTTPTLGFLGSPKLLMGGDPMRKELENFTVPPPWLLFPSTVAFRYFEIMRISDSVRDDNHSGGFTDLYRIGASVQNCSSGLHRIRARVVSGARKHLPETNSPDWSTSQHKVRLP